MPQPVIGATLIFALGFMVVAGMQIIMSRMMDTRKTFVVGVSLIFGLSIDVVPEAYLGLHPWLQTVFSSSLATATVMAVLLNLLFRIGIAKTANLVLEKGMNVSEAIFTFMDKQGGFWGMRREVVLRAQYALNEFMEAATIRGFSEKPVTIAARFDEFRLDIDIRYEGDPVGIPPRAPTEDELLDDLCQTANLALVLLRNHTDKISQEQKGSFTTLSLYFEH